MKFGHSLTLTLAAALALGQAQPVRADAFVGGLLGGFIGSAIGSQVSRPRAPTTTVTNVTRQQNREVQSALNAFGYDVGVVDGSLGPRSRAAISAYQAYMGFPATGQLTDFERQTLLTAHQRLMAGGPQVMRITSTHRDGVRGLLPSVRDELAGGGVRSAGAYGLPPEVADAVDAIAASSDPTAEQLVQRAGFIQLADLNGDGRTDYILDTSVTGSAFWCNAQACTVQVFASTPDGYVRNDFQARDVTPASFTCQRGNCDLAPAAPVAVAAPVPGAGGSGAAVPLAVPNFFGQSAGGGAAQVSLSSHCNRVAVVTSANGGYTDLNTLTDPVFALNEQFCIARAVAIAEGEALVAQIPGATPQAVAAQCDALVPLMQANVTALSSQPRDAVVAGAAQFVAGSGMDPVDLGATARVCLSSGYLTDNMSVAVGSALILVALGESGYAELPGHHLMQGIGARQRRDLAEDWLRHGVPPSATVNAGFAPGPQSRNQLINAALDRMSGAQAAPVPVATQVPPVPQPSAPVAPPLSK